MKNQIFAGLILALLLSSFTASGQVNRSFKKGYRGSVELEGSVFNGRLQSGFEQPGELIQLSTVHGGRLGNGLFLGAGLGYAFWLSEETGFASLFVDAKYNIKDAAVSPFVEGRAGYSVCSTSRLETGGMFVNAAAGVDFGRFTARLGYEYLPIKQLEWTSHGQTKTYYALDRFFLSFAFNF